MEQDCLVWLSQQPSNSIHAVVTDPPYGLHEYSDEQQDKMRSGRGGVWRIPPSFDGNQRSPIPRFTVLSDNQINHITEYLGDFASTLIRCLVPGGHMLVASNPLLSDRVATALRTAKMEKRGEIIRLVQTMRGGDRPKGHHEEFPDVSVMPRSQWEPWLLFRKPFAGTVAQNLDSWGVGALRRREDGLPFGDVIKSSPTNKRERQIANHPSLKPQKFMREVVRAVLPLGHGVVFDAFAGSGSTLAAAHSIGYQSIGCERDPKYFDLACEAIPSLAHFET